MKQFLVPALLLALVGTAAALAVNSAPSASAPATQCHESVGMPAMCPISAPSHCDMGAAGAAAECSEAAAECKGAAAECTPEKAENCPTGDMSEECQKRCEDKQELDCCKKKLECGDCKKTDAPVQKP